jgi:hypothetical protein
MTTRDQRNQYAAELNERYEAFVRWATEHWPNHESPLMESDFAAARRELGLLCGARLGGGDRTADTGGSDDSSAQYLPVNPMPWP